MIGNKGGDLQYLDIYNPTTTTCMSSELRKLQGYDIHSLVRILKKSCDDQSISGQELNIYAKTEDSGDTDSILDCGHCSSYTYLLFS